MCLVMIKAETEKAPLHFHHNVYGLRRPSNEIHKEFRGDAFLAVFNHSGAEMKRLIYFGMMIAVEMSVLGEKQSKSRQEVEMIENE
ncbi:uncharacterized protein MONOS_14561 [Monocercomonoides exilis]|uniref:uncharacterized protein n=1 Tax=Monocercomonoides exilis TaxID=2049356 RepID=UPI003559D18F|nr:hypothetical protein MONOS_14561 [Monocercomonoides exilis]|eukprot:MONOS_14561.1-p1 / transcript=MONOS_14561.1 / gene=MONOS_14561 / organism=Monocercomonoides_exilis_PA203 / gene_product=unspecified product / transcript_product=unspecified product / location=Mono_scaffold01024:18107-18487(+) / protein_length=86 / sequence_SO=supercontig / SO=protein_coding / is_pseudo=false